jgi:hypothetical protein
MKDFFNQQTTSELIERINKLNPESQQKWGKMSVDKMLAHCNVTYDMVFENTQKKTNLFIKILLKIFVKNYVVNEIPYKKNIKTAPEYIISDSRNFDIEKNKLIGYLNKCQELGANYFEGKESHSFGKLTSQEWNNLFYKHLDHHLTQFGV